MWKKLWNRSNCKVLCLNIVTAFALNLYLEWMERKSIQDVMLFMGDRTFVFLYNSLILFVFLSIVFVVKKKYFIYCLIAGGWFVIGTVNGVVLNSRKTPFTVVDLTVAKSVLPILSSYFEKWQIVGMVVGVVMAVVVLVCVCLYSPVARKSFDQRANALAVFLLCIFFALSTYIGVGKGLLIGKFDNLIAGYKAYGVTFGFCVTAFDTGIDRPIEYSAKRVKKIKSTMEKKLEKQSANTSVAKGKTPDIIFIQLESFFDLSTVDGITLSEDNLPNIHAIQEKYTSGYLTVPVYGAGTINTEFEAISGMNTEFFGTGEYPYRSILQNKTCESMAYWLKELGYDATVIHNNNATFYDRDRVFENLGFDRFITSENMEITERNSVGWADDSILTKYIMETLNSSGNAHFIYTISVQGHGDYPTDEVKDPKIRVSGEDFSEKYLNQLTYYANQTYQMDEFIGELLEKISESGREVMVVAYGDHLPGLDFENDELASGSKYKTPYFIWDNFGYNAEKKKAESGDVKAYQLASKVLAQIGIRNGVMNQYHQTMQESKNYKKNMKLLQYDMLYGSDLVRQGEGELKATEIKYGIFPITIKKIRKNKEDYLLVGDHFTDCSRVYVNGIEVKSKKISTNVLKIKKSGIKDGDEIVIHQVSETNEKLTLNKSQPYKVKKALIKDLYHQK